MNLKLPIVSTGKGEEHLKWTIVVNLPQEIKFLLAIVSEDINKCFLIELKKNLHLGVPETLSNTEKKS